MRRVALLSLVLLVGCPMAPAEPTVCDRLRDAIEARRLRCVEPRPEDAIDCAEVFVRDPDGALLCLIEIESARCDEPLPANCAGQLIPR